MAPFYGSASVNLTPLLFRGNKKSTGINVIIHNDVSYSMNLNPYGSVNYFSPRTFSGGTNVSIAATMSMFYDGFFVQKLQDYLRLKKIGDKAATPNLYAYFDYNTRKPTSSFSITNNSTTLTISDNFIKGETDSDTVGSTGNTWRTGYINNGGPFNIDPSLPNYFNKATMGGRQSIPNLTSLNLSPLSEDVHGNLWSIFYAGNTAADTIGSGEAGTIGQILLNRSRKNSPTFVITASNEQENSPASMLNQVVTTKQNANFRLTLDRTTYAKPGLRVVRYDKYFDEYVTLGEVENWFKTAQFLQEGTTLDAGLFGASPPPLGYSPNDANIGIGSTTVYTTASTIGAGTSIFQFPPDEDDIIDCSYMWIGYFRPNADGNWKFGTRSNEKSFIWIDDENDLANYALTNQTSTVITGWKYGNAKVQNSADRGPTDIVTTYSANLLSLKAGKLYPIRIIFGNRSYKASDSINYPPNAQGLSPRNTSELTVFFERFTGSGSGSSFAPTNSNDSTGSFFGAEDVWNAGSEFFPPPIVDVTRTIKEEVVDKNYRIIALSSYKQTSGSDYDGVFFKTDPLTNNTTYRYINFQSGGNYTRTDSQTELATWSLGNYYNPVGYAVSSNFVNNTNANGIGVSIFVNKYNSYYIATVNSLSQGSGYRIGDRVSIAGTTLGESTPVNDLVLEVTQVEDSTYSVTATASNNQAPSFTITPKTNASFEIIKNPSLTGTVYTKTNNGVRLSNPGAGYTTNDRLLISGFQLDGTSSNDVDIIVTSVNSTGQIQSFDLGYLGDPLKTPTNYIDYSSVTTTYNPQSISGIAYSTVGINSVGYTTSIVSGIAYTTVNIANSGIAYTYANISGIAFTSYTIDSITYAGVFSTGSLQKAGGPNPVVVTTNTDPHGLVTGDYVTLDGTGNTNFDNKTFQITVTGTNTFEITVTGLGNGSVSATPVDYILSSPGSTNYAIVNCPGHSFVDGDKIDIVGVGDADFLNTFTITGSQTDSFRLVGTSTSPYFESSDPIPSSSGTAILRANGVLTIVSNPNNVFTTGVGVTVVQTSVVGLNTTYTLQQYTTTTFGLIPDKTLAYPLPITVNTSGSTLGLLNAPAVVTTTVNHPFLNGQKVTIQSAGASFDGTYTITTTNYAANKFALNGKINPPSYNATNLNGAIAALADSNPVVTTITPHQLNTGDTAVIQDCTNTFFNGTYVGVTVYSPTSFGLVNKQNPTTYSSATNGLVGINSEVIVTTTTNHNYFDGYQINIYSNTYAAFNGVRTIKNVLSPRSFTLVGTANTTDYRARGLNGRAGLTNLGAIVTSNNHNLTSGISINISGYTGSPQNGFNGIRQVATVLDANRFTLVGTSNTTNYSTTAPAATFVITSGAGSNASFNIRRVLTSNSSAKYSLNSISAPGSGYRIGDKLLITGNKMGGVSAANDSIITVNTIDGSGGILTIDSLGDGTINGVADATLDYSDINGNAIQFTPTLVPGAGQNSQFTVVRDGTTTYKVTLNNGGQDYYVNDRIVIPGISLGGSPTNINNLFLTVSSTNALGAITGIGTTGLAALGAPIRVNGITTVSTASSLSIPYNLEQDGGTLDQKHETLELAKLTNGGLFKIDRVFVLGDPSVGIATIDNRESLAAALADFIDENR